MKQGTEEWFEIRRGKITASRFSTVLANPRTKKDREAGNLSKSAKTYLREIIAEVMTGESRELSSEALTHGNVYEGYAREEYELHTLQDVEDCGFIQLEDHQVGGSPDGLVGEDGIIEIKCPYNTTNHIETLELREVPKKYIPQIQGNLWVTNRRWCDYISFDPRISGDYEDRKMIVIRVERDEEFIESLKKRVFRAEQILEAGLLEFKKLGGLKFVKEGAHIFSSQKISYTKRELIKIFSEANDLLRKEGIREGIERFSEFSNLLFLKLISEIEADREENGEIRILEKQFCWESFENLDAERMLEYINNIILPRLVNKYNHSGDVFQKELLIKNPPNLKKIVTKLSSLKLLDADSDIKGDAFEYFLKNSVSVGTDLGEYFTPRHVVKLMVELVDPKFQDTIYDPACGTGGFLIEAVRQIKSKCKQTKENTKVLKEKTIYGREISGTAKIAKMNMIIIGDGHNNIIQMDSLETSVKGDHDIVLTNFPFSQKTDYSSLYGFNTEDANPIFMKHVIDALSPNGIAGVVVPEGLLFNESADYIKIRRMLVEDCNVIAVIKLHEFVFKPYTGQPTSILIFKKGKATKKIWFFDVKEDGYKKTGSKLGRAPIKKNDLITLRQVWKDKETTEQSFTIDIDQVNDNDFKLSMDNYRNGKVDSTSSVELGEICEIKIGGTPKRKHPEYWGGNNSWVKIRDMKSMYIDKTDEQITDKGVKESNVKLLPKGTVLFSFKLTIGKVAITKRDLYTNEAIAGIIPRDDRVLSGYLYYILPRIDYSQYYQRATKGKTLNTKSLNSIKIPLPSKAEQKKIVNKLMEQDKKIRSLKKKIEDVEESKNVTLKNI